MCLYQVASTCIAFNGQLPTSCGAFLLLLRQGGSLLSRLGLRDDAIRSVMMARDIVPRVFCCDYSLVAEILRGWGPSWRDHTCLTGGVTGEQGLVNCGLDDHQHVPD